MCSPYPWRPEARRRVATRLAERPRRRCFSARRISVVIRLLPQWKFVAWRANSIDPPSNEFDTQVPEKALSFSPIWAHLGPKNAIFVVFAAHRKGSDADLDPGAGLSPRRVVPGHGGPRLWSEARCQRGREGNTSTVCASRTAR